MPESDFYDLPMLVGEQYMLTTILRETRDTILYRATQKELRRDVIVESLRHSAMENQRKVRIFLDSAKAQAMMQGGALSCVLEVFEAEGTWLVAKESPAGEPLDLVMTGGKLISALDVCLLLIDLCKLCMRFDAEGVATARFHMEDIFYHEHSFRLNNIALSGTRAPGTSRLYLAEASKELLPLLDSESRLMGSLASLMKRLSLNQDDSPLKVALFLAELERLHTLMLQPPAEGDAAAAAAAEA